MLPSSWLARWNVLHGAPSAHRFLHELADPCLFSGSQLLQREGDRPQGAFVEVRAVVEAERRVPRLELVRGLEEADDLAVLGIRGHPVPELRREGWRAGFDNRMEPLAEGAIWCLHLADLREHGAFPVRLVRFQFLDALPHRASFLVRKSLDRLRGLLRRLLVDVVFGGHAMVSFLSCRSGEACLPPVKQTVKKLPWISISCFENTVGESSGLLFGLFLTFGEQGLLAIKTRDLDEIRKKVAGEAKRDESISQGMPCIVTECSKRMLIQHEMSELLVAFPMT